MSKMSTRLIQPWELWANPVFLRYCRSRLRGKHFLPWALVVLIATLFIVFLLYTISQRTSHYDWGDGARLALVPLVILQMLLLMFLGTGAVAAGIARESIDGMMDYQRLTPLSPLSKIVGYLFGLPVREYVLASIPLPFVIYCAHRSGILLEDGLRFYSVFLASVVLYHLTALVAGSVVKQKFLAGRLSQFLVVLLYLVLPRFAVFGFVFLVHLTVLPALSELALPFLEHYGAAQWFSEFGGKVLWFRWEFSPTLFSLLIQLALIGVLVVILARKWRDPDCHAVGHGFAVALLGGILALVLGNAFPLIADGSFFQGGRRVFPMPSGGLEREVFGWIVMTVFGLAFFATVLVFLSLIVPTRHQSLRGFRRAAKLGQSRVPVLSDEATSLGFALCLILLGWVGWYLFSQAIFRAATFDEVRMSSWHGLLQALAFCLPLMCFQLLIEVRGWRGGLIWLLLFWVVPPLAAIIMLATGRLLDPSTYMASISGPVMIVYTMAQALMESHPPGRPIVVRQALGFAIGLHMIALPILFVQWRRCRREWRESIR